MLAPAYARRVSARSWGRLLLVPVWLVVLGLLALVVARLLAFDARRVLTLVDAYTLWLYLPAYVVLAAAVCFRARALAMVAAAVVVAHLAWVVPPVLRTLEVPAAATHAPRFRVVTANVMFDNREHDALLSELADFDADVIVLEEVTPDWWRAVRRRGLLRSYPYAVAEPRDGADGMAILSNTRLRRVSMRSVGQRPVPTATIRVGGRSVHLVGVHVVAPVFGFPQYERERQAITELVRDLPRPRLVLGDFNASPYNSWYDELRSLDLREAHESVGDSFATTWPNGRRRLPPVRLDHVFTDPSLVALRVHDGRGHGSDHRPVVVDLAVLAS